MSIPNHVALIGCGFTGTSAFYQLVDQYPVSEITIFEASGRFGPGYAYQPDECRDYLINNTTDTMCLAPSNRRAFVEWLKGRPELDATVDEKSHLPRAMFGDFLQDVVAATRTVAAIKGVKVRLIPAEAKSLREESDSRVNIGWEDGEVEVDIAILTTGRCPDLNAYETPPPGAAARYIANHIGAADLLDDLPVDATIHVLGASLSAYDVVNRLFSADTGCRFEPDKNGNLEFSPGPNNRRVVLCSRSGRLKKMQSRTPSSIDGTHFSLGTLRAAASENGLSLDAAAQIVREAAKAHHADIDWQSISDPYAGCADEAALNKRAGEILETDIHAAKSTGVDNFLVDFFDRVQLTIWDGFAEQLLSADEEKRYRKKFETAYLTYGAPCPTTTAERLLALYRAGRLSIVKGVHKLSLKEDGAYYEIEHTFGIDKAEILINTTGAVDRDVESKRQPSLIQNLVASGLLSPYMRDSEKMPGADVDMETFRLNGAMNIYAANMLLWGPGFFTSSAYMMATIVERLLRAIYLEQREQAPPAET